MSSNSDELKKTLEKELAELRANNRKEVIEIERLANLHRDTSVRRTELQETLNRIEEIQKQLQLLALEAESEPDVQMHISLDELPPVSESFGLEKKQSEETKKEQEIQDSQAKAESAIGQQLKDLEKAQQDAPLHRIVHKLPATPILKPFANLKVFNAQEKQSIIEQFNGASTYFFMYNEKMLANKIDETLKKLPENEIILVLLKDDLKQAFFDTILYGNYSVAYENDQRKSNHYANLFKENILILQKALGDENLRALISTLTESNDFLRMVPLAYQRILAHDQTLDSFKVAEIFGHYIPYQVAKDPQAIKTEFQVLDHENKLIESYKIKEIKIMHSLMEEKKIRDEGVMGSVLVPDNLAEAEEPTIYICWKGTDSAATIAADIQIRAGAESYRRGERQALEQIRTEIKACQAKLPFGKKLKIVVAGHSLGGAYSQLCFNSLQGVLAKELAQKDQQTKSVVDSLERKFIEEETKLIGDVSHQQAINDLFLDANRISGLSLCVANSAGVSNPVQDFSNSLANILMDQGIKQSAHYLKMSGDVVGVTGQGILSNVPDNKAEVSVLHINLETTGPLTTTAGVLGAPAAAMVLFGTGPIGLAAGGVAFVTTLAKALYDKKNSHTNYQFKATDRPADDYSLFCSHNLDGTTNTEDCTKIREQLSNQSWFINLGSTMISQIASNHLRVDTQKRIEMARFLKELMTIENPKIENKAQAVLALLMEELRLAKIGYEDRILRYLSLASTDFLNLKNEAGDNLLSCAIANEKYEFAQKLLNFSIDEQKNHHDCIDLNKPNKNGKTPFILCLEKINAYSRSLGITDEIAFVERQLANYLLNSGVDLSLSNQAVQARQILSERRTWGIFGTSYRIFFETLDSKLKALEEAKIAAEKTPIEQFGDLLSQALQLGGNSLDPRIEAMIIQSEVSIEGALEEVNKNLTRWDINKLRPKWLVDLQTGLKNENQWEEELPPQPPLLLSTSSRELSSNSMEQSLANTPVESRPVPEHKPEETTSKVVLKKTPPPPPPRRD